MEDLQRLGMDDDSTMTLAELFGKPPFQRTPVNNQQALGNKPQPQHVNNSQALLGNSLHASQNEDMSEAFSTENVMVDQQNHEQALQFAEPVRPRLPQPRTQTQIMPSKRPRSSLDGVASSMLAKPIIPAAHSCTLLDLERGLVYLIQKVDRLEKLMESHPERAGGAKPPQSPSGWV
eukprot:TRINITY_DN2323_c0_g1_i1.p1 TRINITY_DN2323_c0_g1~~TRINITY_DN2323_c0_g1_i1.p1  ORF type:complete len:177 (+),score=32.48 TRINITY_DN2323_c0_g1_i1:328-858(+)